MNETLEQHIARISAATTGRLGRKDLPKWITENTYHNGKKFSFKDHEFQGKIAGDESQEIVIIKSAQLGVSELSMRMAAGLVMLMPGAFSCAYVFPSAGFSSNYSKTRFGPIVAGSPVLRNAISPGDIDSAEIKTFGPGKQIYFKGASAGNSAISTTLDAIYFDEYSFMDQVVAGEYNSRLIHSPYKIKVKLSTPTFIGDPISSAYEASKRWKNMCRCHHCSHVFYPSFYDHVRIEGFDKHLDEITADTLRHINYRTAALHCPKCQKVPSLQPAQRFWECENPGDNYNATGYKLSPFDAPNVITTPYLIEASTSYATKASFKQFNLGIPATDSESGITEEDVEAMGVELAHTPFSTHVMGVDLGLTSHFIVGGLDSAGKLGVVHMERVPLNKFRERYWALKQEYRVSIVVADVQPYSDLILSLSEDDPNLYGASFVTKQGLEIFAVKQRDEDREHALAALRQVQVNRNAALDQLLADVRDSKIWVRKTNEWQVFKAHLQDVRRASATLRNGEFSSLWTKSSKGHDHYLFAMLYLNIAAQMRGIAHGSMSTGLPGVMKFKLTGPPPKRA